jgi:hypothetical protein
MKTTTILSVPALACDVLAISPRATSGTKLQDGLQESTTVRPAYRCRAAECAESLWQIRIALKEVSSMSFPGHGREGGCKENSLEMTK